MPLQKPSRILITGASSGIGSALARAYAAPGRTLVLAGRDSKRLAAVAEQCRAIGATTELWQIDVRDVERFLSQLAEFDDRYAFDTVILNAGIGHSRANGEPFEQAEHLIELADTNFRAPAVAAALIAEAMARRGVGAMRLFYGKRLIRRLSP